MKNLLFSVSFFTLLLAVSCKSNSKKSTDDIMKDVSKSPFINVGNQNYMVDIPTGWTTKDTVINNIKFYFLMAPKTNDNFNTNMNIINESMQGTDFDEYKKRTIETIKKYMPSANIQDKGDIKAGDLKGSWFVYDVEQSGMQLNIINYTFPKNGIAYIITGTALKGNLGKYRNTFDAVAKSFKLKE